MCNYNQIELAFKGIFDYLERTEKNKNIVTAAAPIATIGSKRLEKKGSDGRSPCVNGYDLFSTFSTSSTFIVSLTASLNSLT